MSFHQQHQIVTIYNIPTNYDENKILSELSRDRVVVFHDYLAVLFRGSTQFSDIPTHLDPKRYLTVLGKEPPHSGSNYWVYFEGLGMSLMDESRLITFNTIRSEYYKYCTIITRSEEELNRLRVVTRVIGASLEITNDYFHRCFICPYPDCCRPFPTYREMDDHFISYEHNKFIYLELSSDKILNFDSVVKAFLPYNPIKYLNKRGQITVYFNSYGDSNLAMERMNKRKIDDADVTVKAPLTDYTVYISGFPYGTNIDDIKDAIDSEDVNYIMLRHQMCFVSFENKDEYRRFLGSQIRVKGKLLTVKEKKDKSSAVENFMISVDDLPDYVTENYLSCFYSGLEVDKIDLKKRTGNKSFCFVTFKKEADFNKALKMNNLYGVQIRVEAKHPKSKTKKVSQPQLSSSSSSSSSQSNSNNSSTSPVYSRIVRCPLKTITEHDIRIKFRPYGIKDLKIQTFSDHVEYHITFTKENGYKHSFEVKSIRGITIDNDTQSGTTAAATTTPPPSTPKQKSQPTLSPKKQQPKAPKQKTQQNKPPQSNPPPSQSPFSPQPKQKKKDNNSNSEQSYVAFVKGFPFGSTESYLRGIFRYSDIDKIEFNESRAGQYCYVYFKDQFSLDYALKLNGENSLVVEVKRSKKKGKANAKQQQQQQQHQQIGGLPIPPMAQPNQSNPFSPKPITSNLSSPSTSLSSSSSSSSSLSSSSSSSSTSSQPVNAGVSYTLASRPFSASPASPPPQNVGFHTIAVKPKIKLASKNRRMRMINNERAEELTDSLFNFEDAPFEMSLDEAVEKAGFPDVEIMREECFKKMREIKSRWEGRLTEDDIRAILIYTYESDDEDMNSPYKIVNSKLGKRSVSGLRKVRGYILYLLRALRKLPRFDNKKVLYRGIDGGNVSSDKFQQGKEVVWSGFSSATVVEDIAKDFMGDSESPMLFIIRGNYVGYSIEDFSFREEREVILEPKTKLSVVNVVNDGHIKRVSFHVESHTSLLLEKRVIDFQRPHNLSSSVSSSNTYNCSSNPTSTDSDDKLPEGWSLGYSDKYKRYYYANSKTGKSVWTLSEVKEQVASESKALSQSQQPHLNTSFQQHNCQQPTLNSSQLHQPGYPQQPVSPQPQPVLQQPPTFNPQNYGSTQQAPLNSSLLYQPGYPQQPVSPQPQPVLQQPPTFNPQNYGSMQQAPYQQAPLNSPHLYQPGYPYQPVSPQPQPQPFYQQPPTFNPQNYGSTQQAPYQQTPLNAPQNYQQGYSQQNVPEWEEKVGSDGRTYYQNNITKKTQWERPQAKVIPYVPPKAPNTIQNSGVQFWDV